MIAALIRWSIANRFLVLLMSLLVLLAGLVAVRETPLDAIPDLSDVQVIVKTNYPGQAPQVVEDQVTYPLTTAMLAVPKAVNVRGYSFFGDSYVYIIFEDGTDLYWARSRVLEYLAQVSGQLPDGAEPSLGPDATGVGWVYQYALVDRTGAHDLAELTSLQNWFLKFELQSVPGVAEVATIGGMVRQYQVTVDPDALRVYDLTLARVADAIQNGNSEVGGSVLELAEAEYMIRASGYVDEVADLEAIPVGRQSDGTPVLLEDVATIDLGPQIRRGVGDLNGEGEAVGGVTIMRWGGDALATIDGVKAKLAELERSLPEGVEIVETYDRSGLIGRAVDTLTRALGQEFLIVALICAAFLLHLRSSLVIVLTLPLGILAAFIVMKIQGVNANIMSLGGIAIAIGTMVDGAIVMIETLHRHMERTPVTKQNRWEVVSRAAEEVGPAIFFSLIIITISFLPVFAFEAQEGRMFKPLAFTKTYAMAASAILAVTLTPVLLGYFVRGRMRPEHKNPITRGLGLVFRPLIDLVVARPLVLLALSVALGATALYPLQRLGSEFMPALDEGDFLYMPSAFPAVSIGEARELLQQTNKMIKSVPEVATVYGKAGRADTATDPAPLTMIETTIQLKPRDQWRPGMTMDKIRDALDAAVTVPGISNVWIMPIKNRIDMLATGIKTPLGIKVAGDDLDQIARLGEQIERALKDLPGTASVYAERVVGGRYIEVDVKRRAAARYGMNVADVQRIVRSAIGGADISQSVEGLERYPINLRYPRDYRNSLDRLRTLPVVTPTGAHVTLGDLATLAIADGPGMIRSENARLNGWIYVDIAGRDLGSYVAEAKQVVAREIDLPTGYSLGWSGQFQYMERAQERLTLIVPVTLALIVVILFLAFGRPQEVAIILVSLPLALAGGVWFLYALDYNLSIAVGVGFIALAGLTVETSLVLLIFLNSSLADARAAAQAEGRAFGPADLVAAVREGTLLRLRPILMTDATVAAGLAPIMLGQGTSSGVMRRIAAPMVGGLASELIVTLVVLPAIYLLWQRWVLARSGAPAMPLQGPSDAPSGGVGDTVSRDA
ncbi:CusA/CzcA family heavy metal efflux RND transporter [Rhodothalassium salexigens]|uniref:efflux RND transporter permease subunit n=1 Tax=Rhodothalassium salexigens TaxID=1086 RepID=UPI00191233EB|nr:CusA/CzcA family heavy metal efflux RND transporter [Rhodothalassium salexigens]MBK5910308.1 CusA/CzcA family heavy metal efflux RND transporter [Rhodothalassium salexigens]